MDDLYLRYWVGFNRINGIGAARFAALLTYFEDDLQRAWAAPEAQLTRALGDSRAVASIIAARKTIDPAAELARLPQFGAYALTWLDPQYPPLLRQISNPPPLLYVRGTLTEADRRALSIVGTRTATDYGLRTARQLAAALVQANWTVVSGLAKGIDAAAHAAALRANGRTIAFLGHGIDQIYPREHAKLADQIAANGALITEFPIGTPPDGKNFPQRNRLISGIARGTIVVEGSLKSGSLGIARLALDQGREVFAVPGPIDAPQSQGVNQLIQAGEAKLIQQAADVLVELGDVPHAPVLAVIAVDQPEPTPRRRPSREVLSVAADPLDRQADDPVDVPPIDPAVLAELDTPTRAVWDAITAAPAIRVDDLGEACKRPIAQVTTALTMLEMVGLIRQAGGRVYAINETV